MAQPPDKESSMELGRPDGRPSFGRMGDRPGGTPPRYAPVGASSPRPTTSSPHLGRNASPADDALMESMGSVNVNAQSRLSHSGLQQNIWGLSRPSSPAASPGVSPSNRRPIMSPRSLSPPTNRAESPAKPKTTEVVNDLQLEVQALKEKLPQQTRSSFQRAEPSADQSPPVLKVAPASRPSEVKREESKGRDDDKATPAQPTGSSTRLQKAVSDAEKKKNSLDVGYRPSTPPLQKNNTVSALLRIPIQQGCPPYVPTALYVIAPNFPESEGRYGHANGYERHGLPVWDNSGIGAIFATSEQKWVIRAVTMEPDVVPAWCFMTAKRCTDELPNKAMQWLVQKHEQRTWVLDKTIQVVDYNDTQEDPDVVAPMCDLQDYEAAIDAGVEELEEHIAASAKAGYVDNVGSMYRLPRTTQPSQPQAPIPGLKEFTIREFLSYLVDKLGWVDGRPAIVASLVYIDRIRAHGRIVSRRSAHRLIAAGILLGHMAYTKQMDEGGEQIRYRVQPAPEAAICDMVHLNPETMDPLVRRLSGMMDFETAVLESDVLAYCGALRGGVVLNKQLAEEAQKERIPGQIGLSQRSDGMDAIRAWIDESLVSCHVNLPLDPTDPRLPAAAAPTSRNRIGGSASKAAVTVVIQARGNRMA